MRIKEVHINGFGKLTDRSYTFDSGLNLVYGPNEAGKSTLHQFIFAMLYGFYKPYMKRKVLDGAYERCLPWQTSADYRGSMVLENGDGAYRIERVFTKGKESVRVFDGDTGQEITDTFDYNNAYRIHEPARKLIGLNSVGFANTVSISQLSSRTDQELAREIQDNMASLASTRQVEVSVGKVLRQLEERSAAIGSSRKKTSSYAKQQAFLEQLEVEMAEARKAHQEAFGKKQEEMEAGQALETLREEQQLLQRQQGALKARQYEETLAAVSQLQTRQQALEETLARTARFAEYRTETAEGFMRRRMELKNLAEKEAEQAAGVERMLSEQAVLRQQLKEKTAAQDQASEYTLVRDMLERIEGLDAVAREKETKQDAVAGMLAETEARRRETRPGRYLPGVVAAAVLAVAALVLYLLLPGSTLPTVLLAAAVAIGGFSGVRMKQLDGACKRTDEQLAELEAMKKLAETALADDRRIIGRLLGEMGCSSLEGLREKRDRLYKESILADEYRKQAEALKEELAQLDVDLLERKTFLNETRARIRKIQDELEVTEHVFGVTTEEESRTASMAHQEHEKAAHELALSGLRMSELLGGMQVADLTRKIQAAPEAETSGLDLETVDRQLREASESILELTGRRSRLAAEVKAIEEGHRTAGEIADDLASVKQDLKRMDAALQVNGLIHDTIQAIAEEMQNDFAPVVNDRMSAIVSKVTGGKYTSLKVNPAMEVKLLDKAADRMVPVEALSSGTIDLVYLSLRMGVSELLAKGKVLPLILDDCFVQYDDARVREVLDYLAGQERQILLFTCHNREERILNELGIPFNKIRM